VQQSDIRWASRWDTYLVMTDDQIHWFSIINSLMIVLFLSGMVAMIMMRTLHRDISKYNQLETAEEAQEETGWKLVSTILVDPFLLRARKTSEVCGGVAASHAWSETFHQQQVWLLIIVCCEQVHGDVFRAPANGALLSVYVGTGSQLLGMALVTMVFAVLGFLSPANRGGLMTAMLLLFVFMGIFGGYSAGRLYKAFKVRDSLLCCCCTMLMLYNAMYSGLCIAQSFFP
jgi:transmembrane 9 superfamily protein 2/4